MTAPRPIPDLPGVEHRFIEVAGLRMHVALAGEGEPLVLMHGWPQHWWQWRHLIPRLATRHRVICPDLRGLGWTQAPADGYRPDVMADDVIGLLDRLGVRRFGLVGHDWGGLIGYLLALRHADRVTGYLVLNTASPFLRPTPRVLLDGARLWHIAANAAPYVGPWLAGSAIPKPLDPAVRPHARTGRRTRPTAHRRADVLFRWPGRRRTDRTDRTRRPLPGQ
jgi:pimeloyl-ACP methyl ester carboxylesterase